MYIWYVYQGIVMQRSRETSCIMHSDIRLSSLETLQLRSKVLHGHSHPIHGEPANCSRKRARFSVPRERPRFKCWYTWSLVPWWTMMWWTLLKMRRSTMKTPTMGKTEPENKLGFQHCILVMNLTWSSLLLACFYQLQAFGTSKPVDLTTTLQGPQSQNLFEVVLKIRRWLCASLSTGPWFLTTIPTISDYQYHFISLWHMFFPHYSVQ